MMWKPVSVLIAVTAIVVALWTATAHADDNGSEKPAADATAVPTSREELDAAGFQFSATYIGEVLGNVSGGVRTGGIYTGRLDLGTTIDLEKVFGWTGATFHANMYQIHGDGLSRDFIGNLMLVSGVEALPATRLYELWIEQKLLGGRVAVRVGQQASDVEFFDSSYDDMFANSALGWPGITGVDLPGGGPSPPLAVPGVRLKAHLSDNLTAFFAVFDGYAAPPGPEDSQILNPHGVLFRVNDPPWWIGQLKYKFGMGESALPASFTAGAWYHMGEFSDQHLTADGLSVADPLGSGVAGPLFRNNGLFFVYEQMLARSAHDKDKGIAAFIRGSTSPSDRNLIDLYFDGGFLFTGFSEQRPNDKFGVAATFARISPDAQQLDRDIGFYTGTPYPVRDYEAILEISYQAELQPNVLLQPIFQYVLHPGGGAVDPNDPTQTHRIKDAVVFGMRMTLTY